MAHIRALALSIHLNSMHKPANALSSWIYIHSVCASRSYPSSSSIQYTFLGWHAILLDRDPFSLCYALSSQTHPFGLCNAFSSWATAHSVCSFWANTFFSWTDSYSVCAMRSHPELVHLVYVTRSHPGKLPIQSTLFKLIHSPPGPRPIQSMSCVLIPGSSIQSM